MIPNLDAAANLFIGRELGWGPFKGLMQVMRSRAMEEDVRKTLEQLDIHIPSLRMEVDEFSGGQRQAIAVARAIRWKAKLVILDEPTAALSVPEQRKVLSLVRQLASQGVAVVYITHNILDVIAVTDRLAILHRGRKAGEIRTKDVQRTRDRVADHGQERGGGLSDPARLCQQSSTKVRGDDAMATATIPNPAHARNMRLIGYSDQGGRPDGNQLMVHRGYAYVGHMYSQGISIIDVRDPRAPRFVKFMPAPTHTWNIHLQAA